MQKNQSFNDENIVSVTEDLSDDKEKLVESTEKEEKLWKVYIKNNVAENVLFCVSATEENISEDRKSVGRERVC